jgi:hypothetical protein
MKIGFRFKFNAMTSTTPTF